MIRRVVAGILLGLIVFGAASIVSRGLSHPDFLKAQPGPDHDRPSSGITASVAR